MTPRPAPAADQLRIGDVERERASSELADHYAQGRLDREEHAERLDRIWAARTRAELEKAFADLPGRTVLAPPASARPTARIHLPGLPGPLVAVLVVLGAIALVTQLPLILVGLGVWFFFLRGGCGSRSSWGHPRRW